MSRARETALNLPGGELTQTEQEEIITMLERMRDERQKQLNDFVAQEASVVPTTLSIPKTMEVDSAASTPAE
jgi:hypothetical protein